MPSLVQALYSYPQHWHRISGCPFERLVTILTVMAATTATMTGVRGPQPRAAGPALRRRKTRRAGDGSDQVRLTLTSGDERVYMLHGRQRAEGRPV
jgi:hypothetical protein